MAYHVGSTIGSNIIQHSSRTPFYFGILDNRPGEWPRSLCRAIHDLREAISVAHILKNSHPAFESLLEILGKGADRFA